MGTRTRFFDTRAQTWEAACYPPPVRERLQELIQQFSVQSGEGVLDVGTGPGVLIPYLRQEVGLSGQVCSFDLSLEMIRQAKEKDHTHRDMIIQADVHHIPFANGVFDRVICFAAFPHFESPGLALQEMSRVLKSGGVLVVAHLLSRQELADHHGTHNTVARDLLPSDAEMKRLFAEAGLSLPQVVDIPGRYLAKGYRQRNTGR